jgi:signal transduction histidine kinase
MTHLSARSRLTLLYTGLVLVAGVVLTALTYVLMRGHLEHRVLAVHIERIDGSPLPAMPELSDQVRDETMAALLAQAAIALAVVAVLAAVLGWLVAGRVLRPIRAISATAQRLSAERLSDRVPVHPPHDELAALATTVNGMLDRISHGVAERDRALEGQRLFTANAAHELRTPLTTIRTAVDVTLDGSPSRSELLTMAEDVRAAADDSRHTLDGLLALARSHAGVVNPRPADLGSLADSALNDVAGHLSAQDISVRRELLAAPLSGDPVLLARMTVNLVGNAVRHNHVGGRVMVVTGGSAEGVFLRVRNSGRAVSPDRVDQLLEPFVRAADGGAGLGLSIVWAVVQAHRGSIDAVANQGGGLDITVRFPGL